jgi:hypothetical protein
MGQPASGLRHCQWDGSIHPSDFVRLLQEPYTDVEVADWKYGWPHKVYLTTPNPNPEKQRIVSSTYDAGGRPNPTYTWGTYQSLHLKFYTEHLREYELLPEYADLIFSSIGIWFQKDEKGLSWATKKPNQNPVST